MITLASPRTIIQKDILMTIETALALEQARRMNRAAFPSFNYLPHHLTPPLDARRQQAETATNSFERLILRLK